MLKMWEGLAMSEREIVRESVKVIKGRWASAVGVMGGAAGVAVEGQGGAGGAFGVRDVSGLNPN